MSRSLMSMFLLSLGSALVIPDSGITVAIGSGILAIAVGAFLESTR